MVNTVLANIGANISTSPQTLSALFSGTRAGKYSAYENVQLINRGGTDLTIYSVETGFAANAGNSNTLAAGESIVIRKLNTDQFSVKGTGSGDSLDFQGDATI